MSISIAEKIEKVRAESGLTQPEFADEIGVSINTYKAIIKRGSSPRFEIVERVAARWPKYALWLVLEEEARTAGQIAPGSFVGLRPEYVASYQIIDCIDRKPESSIVQPTEIDHAIFLHTSSEIEVSTRVRRFIESDDYRKRAFAVSPKDYNSCGTAMLLVLRNQLRDRISRAVLVKDGFFDIREIGQKAGIYGLLGTYRAWFEANGIRRFDIVGVNPFALDEANQESGEISVEDLKEAPTDTLSSFEMWQASFQI